MGSVHLNRNMLVLGLLSVVVCLQLEVSAQTCSPGWARHENTCYLFSHETETWADAEIICAMFGGSLAEARTQSELSFISTQVRNRSPSPYWIAANDLSLENHFYWIGSGQ